MRRKPEKGCMSMCGCWLTCCMTERNTRLQRNMCLCPTLCDLRDCNQPGSSIQGIFRARTLEWVTISYSKCNHTPIKINLKNKYDPWVQVIIIEMPRWQPTPVFLPGESQGQRSLVGCHLWGRRVRHDWSNLAAAAAADPSPTFS